MKILIISQNSYPKVSPRAFRTAELAEQLVKQGHEVVVYSVCENYDYSDYSRRTGVVMKNIKTFFFKDGNVGNRRINVFDRLLFHFFKNTLFWPHIEFHFRVGRIIRDNPNMDLLITIAFPHTIHTGAARAKKKYPSKFPKLWISDCGDPFTLNPFINVSKRFVRLEKEWCSLTDYITVPTSESIKGYYSEFKDKIKIIPQGFDFSKTPIDVYQPNSVPTFVFVGTVYPGVRDPRSFMDYLLTYPKPYKFKLLMTSPLEEEYIEKSDGRIQYIIGLNRPEVIKECSKAEFLINIINPSSVQSPSKLIDYGIARRPILDISSNFREVDLFKRFIIGDYSESHIIEDLDSFKIETVAAKFLALANKEKN